MVSKDENVAYDSHYGVAPDLDVYCTMSRARRVMKKNFMISLLTIRLPVRQESGAEKLFSLPEPLIYFSTCRELMTSRTVHATQSSSDPVTTVQRYEKQNPLPYLSHLHKVRAP